jgi:uncharacterized protein
MNENNLQDTPTPEEKNWGLAAHAASLIGFVIPFGNILGPLVVWLMKKDTMNFVDDHGKEALNFNITIALIAFVCFILMFVVIGVFLLLIVVLVWLIFTVIAMIEASKGNTYRYPFAIRLVN